MLDGWGTNEPPKNVLRPGPKRRKLHQLMAPEQHAMPTNLSVCAVRTNAVSGVAMKRMSTARKYHLSLPTSTAHASAAPVVLTAADSARTNRHGRAGAWAALGCIPAMVTNNCSACLFPRWSVVELLRQGQVMIDGGSGGRGSKIVPGPAGNGSRA